MHPDTYIGSSSTPYRHTPTHPIPVPPKSPTRQFSLFPGELLGWFDPQVTGSRHPVLLGFLADGPQAVATYSTYWHSQVSAGIRSGTPRRSSSEHHRIDAKCDRFQLRSRMNLLSAPAVHV